MGRLDNTPQPVREGIAVALMIAAVTATAASLLQQPLFIPGGFILFLIFYIWKIHPQVKAAYQVEEENALRYDDDATYQPLLDRFSDDGNAAALVEGYRTWAAGPHDNEVRLRFLQSAILALIDAGEIYQVENLMGEAEHIAQAEGLEERFKTFRANCDIRIAEIAQSRL